MKTFNKEDLEQTIKDYTNLLYRLCFMTIKNDQDTKDILQETFIKYMKKAPSFSSEEHKKAWLIKVSQNKCKDFLRFHNRHKHVSIEEAGDVSYTYQNAAENDKEEFELLWNLAPKYRSIIILHYVEGYSMEEVADLLGITLAAARKRLQRARSYVKTEYDKEKNNG